MACFKFDKFVQKKTMFMIPNNNFGFIMKYVFMN